MKILALTRYDTLGASSRLRFFQHIDFLEQSGWEVTISPLFDNAYLETLYTTGRKKLSKVTLCYLRRLYSISKSNKFDALWIEKELFPFLPATVERALHFLDIPYVVDYDDAIFHSYDSSKNCFVRLFLKNKIEVVMKKSSLVTAGNKYLAERAQLAGASKVWVVPTVVDIFKYTPRNNQNKCLIIGWMGSPATEKYLQNIVPALQKLSQNIKFKLVAVGAKNFKATNIDYEIQQWTEETEVDKINQFDIGIMPLPDEPWERGKCGYKLIQYMACGKPVVASPVGVNKQIVTFEKNGYLASSSDEWVRYLLKLCKEPQTRVLMGNRNRKKVEQLYSLQKTNPIIKQCINIAIQQKYH